MLLNLYTIIKGIGKIELIDILKESGTFRCPDIGTMSPSPRKAMKRGALPDGKNPRVESSCAY